MKILITGVSGFFGASLAAYAGSRDHGVVGFSRSEIAQPVDQISRSLDQAIPDAIVHCVGMASVAVSIKDPEKSFSDSVMTLRKVLDAVRLSEQRPVILFPSSAAVYGNVETLPISEATAIKPVSPYGFHKAAAELAALEYAECFGLNLVACRIFSAFGPLQRRLLVWELYEQFAADNATVTLHGTGRESRDFLSIDDISAAFLGLAEARIRARDSSFEAINVASGVETSVSELAGVIGRLMGSAKPVTCLGQTSAGDPLNWRADITRLKDLIPQWKPADLETSLKSCISVWQKKDPAVRGAI